MVNLVFQSAGLKRLGHVYTYIYIYIYIHMSKHVDFSKNVDFSKMSRCLTFSKRLTFPNVKHEILKYSKNQGLGDLGRGDFAIFYSLYIYI